MGWAGVALGVGAALGLLLSSCFNPPELTGPYQCSQLRTCALDGYSCVDGVCCKTDGGIPVCPLPQPDGGQDAGQDAGADAGQDGGDDGGTDGGTGSDGGCTLPGNLNCTLGSKLGNCANGQWSCATGTLRCAQVNFPQIETCDGTDEDCDGVVDDYPCQGGPPDFLSGDPDYVFGVRVANKDVQSGYGSCLLYDATLSPQPEFYDAGNWRGFTSHTHFFYAEKADGGWWDLSRVENHLRITFSGAVFKGGSITLANYFQPIVYFCGPGGWRRYNAYSAQVKGISGNTWNVVTTLDPDGGGDFGAYNGPQSLLNVSRVEVMFTPADPLDGGIPSFDAGITAFGFTPF